MSGRFQQPLDVVAKKEGTGFDVPTLYNRAKLALLTGWTYEYIDTLGMLDQQALLQVYEAEQQITASYQKAQSKKPRKR